MKRKSETKKAILIVLCIIGGIICLPIFGFLLWLMGGMMSTTGGH